MMQSLHFVHILSDIGAGKRGSHEGVAWLSARHGLPAHSLFENGEESRFLAPPAKYIDNFQRFFSAFLPPLSAVYQGERFPVILTGDHSNAIGTLSALCHAYPNKRVGVIWIDAHADLHTPYTTPSGNLHGMSLAALIREDNQTCAHHAVSAEIHEHWQALKQLAPNSASILPQDICFLGLRDYEAAEAALIEAHNIPHYSVEKMRELGFAAVFEQVKKQFAEVDLLYVSFDVDSLDSGLLTATGTPVANGFTETELMQVLEAVLALPALKAFELTEFNPTLSPDSNQYELVSRLFAFALARLEARLQKNAKNRPLV